MTPTEKLADKIEKAGRVELWCPDDTPYIKVDRLTPDDKTAIVAALRAGTDRALLPSEVRTALEFYADPFAWKKEHDPENDVQVPDFYSEINFGDTAEAALALFPLKGNTTTKENL
jgi:hypothetical protein